MTIVMRPVLFAAVLALLPRAALAQYAQPAPLYPYAVQPGQPYAIEVAPNTYVIQRPARTRNYPYVRCVNGCDGLPPPVAARSAARRVERRATRNDPALVEQLRQRHTRPVKREVVNTTRIVREKPVVVEHQRVVDDPPRVIERRHYVDDAGPSAPADARAAKIVSEPPRARVKAGKAARLAKEKPIRAGAPEKAEKRVIRAEAEVTILGPDRMSIRLFRQRPAAKAEAE